MTLQQVGRFHVPASIVEGTEKALREAGEQGHERFVLWSGEFREDSFEVQSGHVPEQTAYRLESGLCVRVEGEALFRLNRTLYESGETLAVQIHAHPTDAYHSETDDTYPIVTALGGLSVVAPDFCAHGLFTDGTAAYRLCVHGWTAVAPDLIEVM